MTARKKTTSTEGYLRNTFNHYRHNIVEWDVDVQADRNVMS